MFQQPGIDKIGQRWIHGLAGGEEAARDLAEPGLVWTEQDGRHFVSARPALAIVDTAVTKAALTVPADGVFKLAFAVTELKSGGYLIAEPDEQIHIGISKPAPINELRILPDGSYFS
jgi:hypothetical protein